MAKNSVGGEAVRVKRAMSKEVAESKETTKSEPKSEEVAKSGRQQQAER